MASPYLSQHGYGLAILGLFEVLACETIKEDDPMADSPRLTFGTRPSDMVAQEVVEKSGDVENNAQPRHCVLAVPLLL